MGRRKQDQNEYVAKLYGINRYTHEIQEAWLTRGQVLHLTGKNGATSSHLILHGRKPEAEATAVFDMLDVKSIPIAATDGAYEKQILAELKKISEERKKEAENNKSIESDG